VVIGTTFDHFSQKNAFLNFIFIKIFIKIRLKKKVEVFPKSTLYTLSTRS